jgi:uncharacterized membrane protein
MEEREHCNPALSRVIERNVRTMAHVRQKDFRAQSSHDRVASVVASFSGSMLFLYLHAVWFFVWILINSGWIGIRPFDPFPYGHLATFVSLEAIFLSTLVLITQKRLRDEVERRANLDLHVGLLAEHELTQALRMLHAIQQKLGIETEGANELADLEMETMPEDVLAEIARLHLTIPPPTSGRRVRQSKPKKR